MLNYKKTKDMIKHIKKLYFDSIMMIVKKFGSEIDFSDLDDDVVLMLKNTMALLDEGFDLILSQAKQNDEMAERLIKIESKLDAALTRNNQ